MTRDEYIAAFKAHIVHPFGGHGAPNAVEIMPIFAAFLRLDPPPPWKPQRKTVAEGRGWKPAWNEDDTAVVKVACWIRADLDATARALGRQRLHVIRKAYAFRPKVIPPAWARAYEEQGAHPHRDRLRASA
jgi:hypothetical protein